MLSAVGTYLRGNAILDVFSTATLSAICDRAVERITTTTTMKNNRQKNKIN